MTTLQHARAEYEASKYLQLFSGNEAQSWAVQPALRGSFNGYVDLSILRLGVYGAFIVINDSERLHFVASGHRDNATNNLTQVALDNEYPAWLSVQEVDRSKWISLFQKIQATKPRGSDLSEEGSFSITNIHRDHQTVDTSAANNLSNFSFFAGVPLTSKNGHNIGAICVVDQRERPSLSPAEAGLLSETARTCVELLELARERKFRMRWTATQDELDTFLESKSLHAQLLEEPKMPNGSRSEAAEKATKEEQEKGFERMGPDELGGVSLIPPVKGEASKELVDVENVRDHRIASRDNAQDADTLTAKRSRDDERGPPKGETAYRKVFRRAAECLRVALEADGVLFVDGLIGFHGGIQPLAEPEQELEREMASLAVRNNTTAKEGQASSSGNNQYSRRCHNAPSPHTRLYTSAEYLKGVRVERSSEILGLSGSHENLDLVQVSESTFGLPHIDEGFLQRMMDRHPDGAIWYSTTSGLMKVEEETLVHIDLEEEARKLMLVFKKAKQLIFKPLTELTSLKRLGACMIWRNSLMPTFTDAVDLRSLKGFVRVVESELARYDASLVAKQRETFVSSVSHELRTPLHGILGAVQLLNDSELDSIQRPLAEIIGTCGSTLHETLTSVLSYAKINQFDWRQHQYRQRYPPDTVWALSGKEGLASGPERDYEGLYICTNFALLCEETLSVLEAGKSFYNPHEDDVIVVCNVVYENNWDYFTEPGALRRIATNLIGNALKYTNKGSIIVTLEAARLIEDPKRVSNDLTTLRTLTLTVKDTGRGMSKEFLRDQLFLPFTQEDSNSAHGVGLGMSIVKSLVSLLGGEIEVQSVEEKGTEIHVRLPMRMCTPDDDEKGRTASQFERDIQTIRNHKMSAVMYGFPDSIRDSLTNYLRDWFECKLLESIRDAKPDIVLVEVLETVRETSGGYGERGVLLSIVTVPSMMGQRMQMVDGYSKWERVPRPLGPQSVAKALLSCLGKLNELRMHGENVSVDKEPEITDQPQHQVEPLELQNFRARLPYEQYLPDSEKEKVTEALKASADVAKLRNPSRERSKPSLGADPSAASNEGSSESKDHQAAASDAAAAPRILIVDDNALNLRLLGAFLKKNGNRNVTQARDGEKAVEAVQSSEEAIDIIFMDLSMPVMDGFQATRQIRKMEAGDGSGTIVKSTVIIALTGLASEEDEDEAFNAGVDLFLTKPLQFHNLADLLRQFGEGTLQTQRRSA